ncbi:UNVERIFIED_CONTAM: hypothetical protein FKN15_056579, partial [Acipenser sinensis]
ILSPSEQFAKRRRTVLWFTVALLVLSLIILVLGLAAGTRTGNVDVAGYYPGIILSFGSFLALVGINLVENRRPMGERTGESEEKRERERERERRESEQLLRGAGGPAQFLTLSSLVAVIVTNSEPYLPFLFPLGGARPIARRPLEAPVLGRQRNSLELATSRL